jgi:hypothetical protein
LPSTTKFKPGDFIIAKTMPFAVKTGRVMTVDEMVHGHQMGYMIQIDGQEPDQRWVLEVELEFDVLHQLAANG